MTALNRLFGDGFRVFFLSAGLFAVLSVLVWELWLAVHAAGGMMTLPPAPAPHLWHAHEMIFGYGAAALGGFFLTAVPNWTGGKAARHAFIAGVAGLWLLGRLALWASGDLPAAAVAAADLAFVPVLAAKVLAQLVKRPKAPQLVFLVMLSLFWAANLRVHLEWTGATPAGAAEGLRAGLLTLCTMIVILGGRVTPGFTRNAMVRAGREDRLPRNPAPLASVAIAAAMSQPLGTLAGVPAERLAPFALLAGLAALARLALWRGGWTRGQPILWTLHLGYGVNGLGFLLWGLAGLGLESEVAALHVLGIGAVGGMTLAVMSRAALGHTGRALVAPGPVALAYALVPAAALARWAASTFPDWYFEGSLLAGLLWCLAFTLFLAALWPVLWGPRQGPNAMEPPTS